MKAEDMFEHIDFHRVKVTDPISGEEYEHDIEYMKFDGSWEEHILFNTSTRLIHLSSTLFGKEQSFILNDEKLQAINQQMKEIGVEE